jgi:hypothetical protein
MVDANNPLGPLLVVIEECAARALVRSATSAGAPAETALYFVALLGHELCNLNADAGVKLLDLVDASTLQPTAPGCNIPDEILGAVRLASNRRDELGDSLTLYHFVGGLQAIMESAGRQDVAEAINRLAKPQQRPA